MFAVSVNGFQNKLKCLDDPFPLNIKRISWQSCLTAILCLSSQLVLSRIRRAVSQLIGASFVNEPHNRWISLYTESFPNATTLTSEKIAQHFLLDIRKKVEAGATTAEGYWKLFRGHVVADMAYL